MPKAKRPFKKIAGSNGRPCSLEIVVGSPLWELNGLKSASPISSRARSSGNCLSRACGLPTSYAGLWRASSESAGVCHLYTHKRERESQRVHKVVPGRSPNLIITSGDSIVVQERSLFFSAVCMVSPRARRTTAAGPFCAARGDKWRSSRRFVAIRRGMKGFRARCARASVRGDTQPRLLITSRGEKENTSPLGLVILFSSFSALIGERGAVEERHFSVGFFFSFFFHPGAGACLSCEKHAIRGLDFVWLLWVYERRSGDL